MTGHLSSKVSVILRLSIFTSTGPLPYLYKPVDGIIYGQATKATKNDAREEAAKQAIKLLNDQEQERNASGSS